MGDYTDDEFVTLLYTQFVNGSIDGPEFVRQVKEHDKAKIAEHLRLSSEQENKNEQ